MPHISRLERTDAKSSDRPNKKWMAMQSKTKLKKYIKTTISNEETGLV